MSMKMAKKGGGNFVLVWLLCEEREIGNAFLFSVFNVSLYMFCF